MQQSRTAPDLLPLVGMETRGHISVPEAGSIFGFPGGTVVVRGSLLIELDVAAGPQFLGTQTMVDDAVQWDVDPRLLCQADDRAVLCFEL